MKKENQRVVISKRLLKEAVTRLLIKKHIDTITISELCQEAGINRTTFYRHYETPRDVLLEIEFEFVKSFYEIPSSVNELKDLQNCLIHICEFLYNNKEITKLFIRNNTEQDFSQLYQSLSDMILASKKVLYKEQVVDEDTIRLMNTLVAYGTYAVVRQWLIEDIPKSPKEIAELIYSSFNNNFTFE